MAGGGMFGGAVPEAGLMAYLLSPNLLANNVGKALHYGSNRTRAPTNRPMDAVVPIASAGRIPR